MPPAHLWGNAAGKFCDLIQRFDKRSTPLTRFNSQFRRTHRIVRAVRTGWSLIELLVVVSLITVLLGIIINTAGEAKGPEAQTKVLVHNVHAIATEFEVRTGHVIEADGATYNDAASIQYFCTQASKTDITRQMMLNLGKEFIAINSSNVVTAINDAWSRSLWYVAYNAGETNKLPWHGAGQQAPSPFVASSGKDGNWGTYDTKNKPNAQAGDNILSFEIR